MQAKEIRDLFDYFDVDGSGAIDAAEALNAHIYLHPLSSAVQLGAVMRQLGQEPSEEEIQMFMDEVTSLRV